jgi:hypothetical protein
MFRGFGTQSNELKLTSKSVKSGTVVELSYVNLVDVVVTNFVRTQLIVIHRSRPRCNASSY